MRPPAKARVSNPPTASESSKPRPEPSSISAPDRHLIEGHRQRSKSILDSIGSRIELGGTVVALLLVLSVFALALIILKLAQFWRERVGAHGRAERALHAWFHGGYGDAHRLLDGDRSAVGATL